MSFCIFNQQRYWADGTQNTAETEGTLKMDAWTPIESEQVGGWQIQVLLLRGDKSPELFKKVVDTLHSLFAHGQEVSTSELLPWPAVGKPRGIQ